jgi:hypothetical protein
MNQINYSTLYACLADLPDGRHAQGQRYEWLYLLTLIAAALLAGQRSLTAMIHWLLEHIENCTHYIRDVSLGEDASQVRAGNTPQALAAFRNALISALRLDGWAYLPNAFRHFCHNVQDSLRFLGALST